MEDHQLECSGSVRAEVVNSTLRKAIYCFVITLLATAFAPGQPPPPSEVDIILRQARQEIQQFEKAGGKKNDPNHPVEKWVASLWAVREKSPGTPDAMKATSGAVALLINAGRFQEVQARVDRIASSDPAWRGLAGILFQAASIQKNFTYFFQKLQSVLPNVPDAATRAAIQLNLGRGWRAQNDDQKAQAAFEAAISAQRDSAPGKEAETELYDLLHLRPGQPAPRFTATAVNGSRISLADYRGKPVVLVFWATH